ncbi:MAG: S1 RNA-binding domain-containing protein [Candidatus Omnitrophota bacterium]
MGNEVKIGDIVQAEVFKITDFGAFVKFAENKGLIHISQVADDYVKDINQHLKVGDKVEARIIKISSDGAKIDLSLKKNKPLQKEKGNEGKDFRFSDFEYKLKSFLKTSTDIQMGLKKNIEGKQFKKRHK